MQIVMPEQNDMVIVPLEEVRILEDPNMETWRSMLSSKYIRDKYPEEMYDILDSMEFSTWGRIRRKSYIGHELVIPHLLNASNRENYYVIELYYKKTYCFSVRRTMMHIFSPMIRNSEKYKVLCLNYDKTCNFIWNLAWFKDFHTAFRFGRVMITFPAPKEQLEAQSLPGEIWKPFTSVAELRRVNTFQMYYSNLGRVASYQYRMQTGVLDQFQNRFGYYQVGMPSIKNKNKYISILTHRAIANMEYYNPNWMNLQVDHINRRPECNEVSNLRWSTSWENNMNKVNTFNSYTEEFVYFVHDQYLNNSSPLQIAQDAIKIFNLADVDRVREVVNGINTAFIRIYSTLHYLCNRGYFYESMFSYEQREYFDKVIDDNPSLSIREILGILNIEPNTPQWLAVGAHIRVHRNPLRYDYTRV